MSGASGFFYVHWESIFLLTSIWSVRIHEAEGGSPGAPEMSFLYGLCINDFVQNAADLLQNYKDLWKFENFHVVAVNFCVFQILSFSLFTYGQAIFQSYRFVVASSSGLLRMDKLKLKQCCRYFALLAIAIIIISTTTTRHFLVNFENESS